MAVRNSARRGVVATIYPGVWPSNASKEAKYSVIRMDNGKMVVRLIYRISNNEKALLTTRNHDELISMVNLVKEEISGFAGGSFYINEYRHVLVPSATDSNCYFAGVYEETLDFDFEGTSINSIAPANLNPGERWDGPRVGIKYKLNAGASDISYMKVANSRMAEYRLSEYIGKQRAGELAKSIGAIKGTKGGSIYVNESLEIFAPVEEGNTWTKLYVGTLDLQEWFPDPYSV